MKHFDVTSGAKSKKAAYVKVETERLDLLLKLLIENPNMQIKRAAAISQIKYPRATALWR